MSYLLRRYTRMLSLWVWDPESNTPTKRDGVGFWESVLNVLNVRQYAH